jgi:CDP-glycerol glycerophosphotransferase (TagB/SpsB family)
VAELSFTFAVGNAVKVLALPLYAVGQAASALVPRDRRRWVVGSGFGLADGALTLYEQAREDDPTLGLTWLTRDAEDARNARARGIPTVPRDSLRGWWATLRAGVVVVTHGFGDVNRYGCQGATVVQLWHGAPLKRLHLDSPAALRLPVVGGWGPARRLLGAMYRRGTSRISVLPVSSRDVVPRMASAFALDPARVPVLGEPRTDVLFTGTERERSSAARARIERSVGSLAGARVVLYAPTWRDGAPDPGIPSPSEWAALDDWLEANDVVLLVRPHPLGAGDYSHRSTRVRLITSRQEPEVNAVLWGVDALVTDYSSVLVDFTATGRPIVFLAPDVEAYSSSRGLYVDYDGLSGGHVERTWGQVLARLDLVLEAGPARDAATAASRALAERFHEHTDGRSAARVVQHVLALVGKGQTGATADSVLFESYYGRNASCNPLAIDREIARRHPDVRRVWAVESTDVVVPAGAGAVLLGSSEWRSARDEARLLVVNDWIRDGWRPRRHQPVLQTWHGTPLKRIALGRRGLRPREMAAVVKQSSRWTAMLAQSPSAARVLKRAYAVRSPMWVEGYPRNDEVVTGSGRQVRQQLGVTTAKVVLYAPTWRDGDLGAGHPLDAQGLARELGQDWTVLVRGHARTLHERPPSEGERVVDVTRHPDASELLVATDVLVTDYSSLMFDFSATGRPMVFFVPDLEQYDRHGRGLYWDLAARAPGPLVTTTTACADAVRGAEDDAPRWAQRYAAWRAEFNPLDDGHAAARVVDRLEREGML